MSTVVHHGIRCPNDLIMSNGWGWHEIGQSVDVCVMARIIPNSNRHVERCDDGGVLVQRWRLFRWTKVSKPEKIGGSAGYAGYGGTDG